MWKEIVRNTIVDTCGFLPFLSPPFLPFFLTIATCSSFWTSPLSHSPSTGFGGIDITPPFRDRLLTQTWPIKHCTSLAKMTVQGWAKALIKAFEVQSCIFWKGSIHWTWSCGDVSLALLPIILPPWEKGLPENGVKTQGSKGERQKRSNAWWLCWASRFSCAQSQN